MSILQLANELGLSSKRVAATQGGEYHSPCPRCNGRDRFIIWEKQGRYYCRQCNVKGDAIQFCRDFLGLGYKAACEKLGVSSRGPVFYRNTDKPKYIPHAAKPVGLMWQDKAAEFVRHAHECLMDSREALDVVFGRGFSVSTLQAFMLGWNAVDQFYSRSEWGLSKVVGDNNKEKKLWLPKGIVIPAVTDGAVTKMKVRRSDWKEGDTFPKYVEVSGSMKSFSVYGDKALPVFVVESELDAMLVQQFAQDLCCCMALGGVSKKPDSASDKILKQAKRVLIALDFDEPGKKGCQSWMMLYPHAHPWPVPKAKSPGDAFKQGVDLRKWVEIGIKKHKGVKK